MAPPILIDDRAGSKELVRFPPLNRLGRLTRLDSADVCIAGNGPDDKMLIGIEVKTVWDLLASMSSGRLQAKQIVDMMATYDSSWLLYYGVYRASAVGADGAAYLQIRKRGRWIDFTIGDRRVRFGYLENFLVELQCMGIRVKHVAANADTGLRECAAWIAAFTRWWSKPWGEHTAMRKFNTAGDIAMLPRCEPRMKRRAEVASKLLDVGLGYERSMNAAKHFKSVREMVNAGPKEWSKVKKIGATLADAIEQAVR